jgi:hypothetical protein
MLLPNSLHYQVQVAIITLQLPDISCVCSIGVQGLIVKWAYGMTPCWMILCRGTRVALPQPIPTRVIPTPCVPPSMLFRVLAPAHLHPPVLAHISLPSPRTPPPSENWHPLSWSYYSSSLLGAKVYPHFSFCAHPRYLPPPLLLRLLPYSYI